MQCIIVYSASSNDVASCKQVWKFPSRPESRKAILCNEIPSWNVHNFNMHYNVWYLTKTCHQGEADFAIVLQSSRCLEKSDFYSHAHSLQQIDPNTCKSQLLLLFKFILQYRTGYTSGSFEYSQTNSFMITTVICLCCLEIIECQHSENAVYEKEMHRRRTKIPNLRNNRIKIEE